ncbi:MAG TPA: TMEM175 family protein [Stellaceae bacterium]|nr:TMEM175 family protein [Stellaceae bacterium]
MTKDRLAAFSDGVIAVIITIMVLELKAPHDAGFDALRQELPGFLSYVLSFVYVAIYWNNHHHFLHLVERVDGIVLWANLHLLFWLSLIPFATSWLGEHHLEAIPAVLYGAVLFLAAIAWQLLQMAIIRVHGRESAFGHALGMDIKGKVSPVLYLVGIGLAFLDARLAEAMYVLVALIWLVPDRRVEREAQQS